MLGFFGGGGCKVLGSFILLGLQYEALSDPPLSCILQVPPWAGRTGGMLLTLSTDLALIFSTAVIHVHVE